MMSEQRKLADTESESEPIKESAGMRNFLEQLVDEICRHGLRLPALIALEAGKPLTFIGGQLLWIGQPLLSLLLPSSMIAQAASLLEDPGAVDELIESLEARS